ncbi:MAG: hypothetical protein LBU24_02070 [Methanocalculaceae archaeon]|nr:hypothetical protein [Methanocalculaceae archaeon]
MAAKELGQITFPPPSGSVANGKVRGYAIPVVVELFGLIRRLTTGLDHRSQKVRRDLHLFVVEVLKLAAKKHRHSHIDQGESDIFQCNGQKSFVTPGEDDGI